MSKNKKMLVIVGVVAFFLLAITTLVSFMVVNHARAEVVKYTKKDVSFKDVWFTNNGVMIRFTHHYAILNTKHTWGYVLVSGKVYMSPSEKADMMILMDRKEE